MRQYELAIRIAQVHHLVDERKYKKALAAIQTLDMRQVRSISDLKVCAEVYTKTEQYEAAKATYLRIYRHSRTRRVLYRLIYLSIRTNALDDAEAYYKEFLRMNPSTRDVLILRYRLDKAAGAPIGQLIEILQELKQEEYIEEWAYELAKLYHRAGRKQECMEECEDILLWFGTGEIVERAKILLDHLQDKDPIPYYDDKDFTVPREEEPNPDDTGSLPDLKEFVKERKAQKQEESQDRAFAEREPLVKEPQKSENKQEEADDEFIDDYEEDDLQDGLDLSQKAKDSIQRLSGFLKHGKKDEQKSAKKASKEPEEGIVERLEKNLEKNLEKKPEIINPEISPERKPEKKYEKKPEINQERKLEKKPEVRPATEAESTLGSKSLEYVPLSQSGTGITQDLAKEISAIYDMEQMEQKGQLQEKAVTVINETQTKNLAEEVRTLNNANEAQISNSANEVRTQNIINEARTPNIAANVVERMTQAIQKSANRGYIPIDIEEIRRKEQEENAETAEEYDEEQEEVEVEQEEIKQEEPEQEELEIDELTKALNAELEQYHKERERQETIVKEEENLEKKEDSLAEEMEGELPQGISEAILEELSEYSEEEEFAGKLPEAFMEKMETEETADMMEPQKSETEIIKELLEEEIEDPEMDEPEGQEEVLEKVPEEATEGITEKMAEEVTEEIAEEMPAEEILEETSEEVAEETFEGETSEEVTEEVAEETLEKGIEEKASEEIEDETPEKVTEEVVEEMQEEMPEEENSSGSASSPLEGYQAPEIPVVQTSYMEMPEIAFEDLPTTRALQQSFQNVLKLIGGELDPSHFVLMGDGTERIVGVSKQIIRIMKETGYLSQGRIAKINANQLNKMDLITFREQLRGNCLLIENAADLLFPTITKIFSIMEEYYGNFVVILADEGTTLDQLFRFVPALARKFKYIIDISKYTKDDYADK